MSAAGIARRGRLHGVRSSPLLAPVLATTSVAAIVALTLLRVADAPWIPQAIGQIILLASFTALAIVEFRASVAIVIVELAVYGAGGHWTLFAGGASGRIVLDAIVTIRALGTLALDWRRSGRLDLGRYAPHAIFIAIAMPAIWMTLGLLNGNRPSDVFGDGNGLAFFAFTAVLVVPLRGGQAPWVRQWLLVACAGSAVIIGLLILVTASGLIPMGPPLQRALLDQLSFGGSFGYLPNGAYRLYLGSGIYLQIGLALTTWRLLRGTRRAWPWALYALLWADVLATYTRGFWIGSLLAVGLTLALGATSLRRPVVIVATSAFIFAIASAAGVLVGFSLPNYVLDRSASILSTGPAAAAQPSGASPAQVPDIAGQVSNEIKADQTRVLLGHIAERPLLGSGFGSIATDYQYGQIYSYELAYLDLLFKTGVVGLLLFLSFPLRLLLDAFRGRRGRLSLELGVGPREASVVVAIVASLLVTGGTNPYLLAAFGLFPILAMIAWLDPMGGERAAASTL